MRSFATIAILFSYLVCMPSAAIAQTHTWPLDDMRVVGASSQSENVLYEILQKDLWEMIHNEQGKFRKRSIYKDIKLILNVEKAGECTSFYGSITKGEGLNFRPILEFDVIYDMSLPAKKQIFILTNYGGGCPATTDGSEKVYKLRSLSVHRHTLFKLNTDTGNVNLVDGGPFK